MKPLKIVIVTLVICLVSVVSFGQIVTKDSVYIIRETDAMSGLTHVYSSRRFICANEAGKIGFIVSAVIKSDIIITATMIGIGGCNENDVIIILFENGEKIVKTSWKKFNCDGETYFDVNEKDMQLLRTQTLSKIRMTNGRTHDNYTGDVKSKDRRYFIQLLYALDNNLITDKK
jgi:glycerate kinase